MNSRRDRFSLRDREVRPEIVDLPAAGGAAPETYPGLWTPGAIDDELGTLTVGAGIVVDTTRCYEVAARAVTVAGGTLASPNYVYLEIPHNGNGFIATTTLGVLPAPTLTAYRHPLLQVARIEGRITVINRLCRDVVSLSGLLGRF